VLRCTVRSKQPEGFPAFARVAISVTGSVDVGREVVQEAFARSIEDLDRFRGECSLEAGVWRIVINTAKTAARRGAFESGELAVPQGLG
jgi:DNA-directed RNA polymerase specialized sigma24 family protein